MVAQLPEESRPAVDYTRRHVRFGWWSLFVFATVGLVLESFHGFKVRAYLDASNDTRRLMWTLAHAHGTILGVVNVVFGVSLRVLPERGAAQDRLASSCLLAASLLLPGGFFLGGIAPKSGDPGLGIIVLPIGAALLLIALFSIARSVKSAGDAQPAPERRGKR